MANVQNLETAKLVIQKSTVDKQIQLQLKKVQGKKKY